MPSAVAPAASGFLVLAGLSGVLHLIAEYRGAKRLTYIFKPLTTALLVAVAAAIPPADSGYSAAVLVGLLFSLAGDVFLMLPRDRFIAGLLSFLAAHIAYLAAFSRGVAFGSRPILLLPYAAAAFAVLWLLWPKLGKLRLPVVLYVGALVAMAWQAVVRAAVLDSDPAYAAAAGAALFVVSDATLAINRFHKPFRAAQALIMTTYVAAQMLIALSVSRVAG